MKLVETILLTKHHSAPAGSLPRRYSISDQPIDKLISNLQEQGIEINPNYSEKEVEYKLQTSKWDFSHRKTIVPLAAEFPNDTTLMVFYLRNGSGLELKICNYDHITQRPPERVIGGTVAGDFGIICELSIEGTTVDLSVIDKIIEAMKKTYESNSKETFFDYLV